MRKRAGKLAVVSELSQRRGAIQAIRVDKGYHIFPFDSHIFALQVEWSGCSSLAQTEARRSRQWPIPRIKKEK